jgi:hypothetical protein
MTHKHKHKSILGVAKAPTQANKHSQNDTKQQLQKKSNTILFETK